MHRWLLAVALVGCSSSPAEGPSQPSCPAEYEPKGGACVARLDPCGEGELAKIGGGCAPIGNRTCGQGFTLSPGSGCAPILPPAACPKGQMAIPGETTCHPVAACGSGTWGSIPVDADTVYVDASYAGSDADGSAAHPFPTVQRGLDAAKTNAVVAIAAGRYAEDLRITRAARVYGVCPEKVEIAGVSAVFAVDVIIGAELHGLAITGPEVGVGVYGRKLLLDHVWIHDAGDRGLDAEDSDDAPGDITLVDSLVEGSGQIAAFSQGSRLRIERSVVRDTKASKPKETTVGILARATKESKRPSELSILRSVVSGHATYGVLVNASAGTIEDSFVTDTRGPGGTAAGGINAHDLESDVPDPHTTLTVRRSVVSKAFGVGIDTLHTDVTLEDVTVRQIDGVSPGSISLEASPGKLSNITVEDGLGMGMSIVGGAVEARRVVVRRISSLPSGSSGLGILAEGRPSIPGLFTLTESAITNVHSVGFVLWSSTGSISDSYVGSVSPDGNGKFGDGIVTVTGLYDTGLVPAALEVHRVVVRDIARGGIVSFGAASKVGGSLICGSFDMQVVSSYGKDSGFPVDSPATIVDLGANACGCDAPHACRAQQASLEPIEPPR